MDDIPEELLEHVIVIQAVWKLHKIEADQLVNGLITLLEKNGIHAPLDQVIDMLEGYNYGTEN